MAQLTEQQPLWAATWGLAITVASALPAGAQAKITALISQVQYRKGDASPIHWPEASLKTTLDQGDGLRTQARAAASVHFPDGNDLQLDQLTEVELRGSRARDVVYIKNGNALAKERVSGTFQGPGFTATSKHTDIEFSVGAGTTRVRCYHGLVYVIGADADLRAGAATAGTLDTLTDSAQVGQAPMGAGAAVRLMSGPQAGQQRAVTGFDPATGTITVNPAFAAPVTPGIDYILTTRPELPVLALPAGTETIVRTGQPPSPPHRTFPMKFADGQERPWFLYLIPGHALRVYNGSLQHWEEQDSTWPLDDDSMLSGHTQWPLFGGAKVIIGAAARPSRLSPVRSDGLGSERSSFSAVGSASPAFSSVGLTDWDDAIPASGEPPPQYGADAAIDIMPYVIASNQEGATGAHARMRIADGSVLAEAGDLYFHYGPGNADNLSEGSLLYRSEQWGDLNVGRQHIFLGPVNNSRLGSLMNFNTADAAIWSAPPNRSLVWRVGYLDNTAPLDSGQSFSGWLGRLQGLLGDGLWGLSLLSANGHGVGFSADLSIPILRDRLDGYMEAGSDAFHGDLVTGGLHLPGLFRRTGVDAFLEYQARRNFNDRISLRLSTKFGHGWSTIGYFSQELSGGSYVGMAMSYRWTWR